MVTYDAQATRRRLLDAAYSEFAQYGIAGARVDRIAEAADSNKAQIYHYFGGKIQLFDAVCELAMQQMEAEVLAQRVEQADPSIKLDLELDPVHHKLYRRQPIPPRNPSVCPHQPHQQIRNQLDGAKHTPIVKPSGWFAIVRS